MAEITKEELIRQKAKAMVDGGSSWEYMEAALTPEDFQKRRYRVARHEAGHAVIHVLSGGEIGGVGFSDCTEEGLCKHAVTEDRFEIFCERREAPPGFWESEYMGMIAGVLAELDVKELEKMAHARIGTRKAENFRNDYFYYENGDDLRDYEDRASDSDQYKALELENKIFGKFPYGNKKAWTERTKNIDRLWKQAAKCIIEYQSEIEQIAQIILKDDWAFDHQIRPILLNHKGKKQILVRVLPIDKANCGKEDLPMENSLTITVREAAKLSKIGINEIYWQTKNNPKFPCFRIGHKVLIHKELFEKWVKNLTRCE